MAASMACTNPDGGDGGFDMVGLLDNISLARHSR
jgi:hypothetical protein